MGRKSNTEVRRQQIIDALQTEMASTGYERASIKSIAERAGLAPGLVHYHFKSKQEILLALVDQLIVQAEQRFDEAMNVAGTAQTRLAAFVSTRVGLGAGADAAQVKAWIGILAEAMGQTKVRNRVAKWLAGDQQQLTALFDEAGSSAPAEHAATLLALILGSFSLHAIPVAGIPSGYAERQLLQWIATVLPGEPRRRR